MSEVILTSIQTWRQKSRDGTITMEEMRLAVAKIREERIGKGAVSAAAKVKKAATAVKKLPINSDDLLAGLI